VGQAPRSNGGRLAVTILVKKRLNSWSLLIFVTCYNQWGKDIRSFPLPLIDSSNDAAAGVPREIYEEHIIEVNEEDKNLHKSLNTEQMAAYKTITSTVDNPNGGVFFIDGPGGTGKTFLYRALLGTVRS
jgi:ATP-dependent DNA helicase PIF1